MIKSIEKSSEQIYNVSKCRMLWLFDGYINMSINQSRLFHSYLSLINPLEPDEYEVEIEISWIIEHFDMKSDRRCRQRIYQAVSDFNNNNLWTYKGKDVINEIKDDSSNEIIKMVEITCGEILKVFDIMEVKKDNLGIEVIHIKCSDEFKRFIFPRKNFVQYDLEYIKNLNSIRCITLYEMFKSELDLLNKRDKNGKTLSQKNFNTEKCPAKLLLLTIMNNLGIDENGVYKNFGHLSQKVLIPCIKNINKYSNIYIDKDRMTAIYTGKKVYRIDFIVSDKSDIDYSNAAQSNSSNEIKKEKIAKQKKIDNKKIDNSNYDNYDDYNNDDEDIMDYIDDIDDDNYGFNDYYNDLLNKDKSDISISRKIKTEKETIDIEKIKKENYRVAEIAEYFEIWNDGTVGKLKDRTKEKEAYDILDKHIDYFDTFYYFNFKVAGKEGIPILESISDSYNRRNVNIKNCKI